MDESEVKSGNSEKPDTQIFSSETPKSHTSEDNVITWEASEYIEHQKSASWYLALTGITLIFGVVLYIIQRDILSLVFLAVMYLVIIVYARRAPRVLQYRISGNGLDIADKHFDFDQFRFFSVVQESGMPSIVLNPTQRFMPPISIYFAPEDADKIINNLSRFLPMERGGLSLIDRAMLKLRF